MFVGKLQTTWRERSKGTTRVELSEFIAFIDSAGRFWGAPRGFVTDGASFPGFLRYVPTLIALIVAWFTDSFALAFVIATVLQFFTGAAFNDDYLRAAVLHDAAYQYGDRPRALADQMFYEAMREDGTSRIRAAVMWAGVRAGGWVAWNEHRRRDREV